MKNILLTLFCFCTGAITINAQKGNHNIQIISEIGIPVGSYSAPYSKMGVGGYIKGEYGFGAASQITLQAGLSRSGQKEAYKPPTAVYCWPLLIGYKHNIKKFYIEPQVGYGWLYHAGLPSSIYIDGGLLNTGYFAIGGGYLLNKRLNIGIRYQQATGDFGVEYFSFVGAHLSYKVLRSKSK